MFPKVQCATPCCRLAAISRFGGFLRRWSVAALALLLWLPCLPAHAGTWQIVYHMSGANDGDGPWANSRGAWPAVQQPGVSNFVQQGIGGDSWATCQGEVHAVLHWVTTVPGDTPPPKVVVREWGDATVRKFGFWPFGFAGEVESGFGHPVIADADGLQRVGTRAEWVVDTGGSTEIVLPTRTLRANILTDLPGGPVTVAVTYKVEVPNRWVSGTNAYYASHLPPDWVGSYTQATVEIENPPAGAAPVFPTLIPGAQGMGVVFRYNTTLFPDAGEVRWKTTVTAPGKPTMVWIELQLVYNKHSVLECQDFVVKGNKSVQGTIRAILEELRHGAAIGQAGYTKDGFLTGVQKATAIHFSLHGASGAVSPLPNSGPADTVTSAEAHAALQRRTWRPYFNVVFAGACSTAGSLATMPFPLRTDPNGVPYPNQMYVGFDRLAWIAGIQNASEVFWQTLKAGRTDPDDPNTPLDYTAHGAILKAQDTYNRFSPTFAAAKIVHRGDPNTTLSVLYLAPTPATWLTF